MADLVVDEFTRLSGLPDGWAQSEALQRVVLWDKGPEKPVPPKKPIPPLGQAGDPEFDLNMIEFRMALEDYEKALLRYRKDREDYNKFQEQYGGPYEINMWSCDAADSLERDPNRYCISSRTRGYSHLKNRGLPEKLAPGPGQKAQEERERQANVDFDAVRRADPVFGGTP